MEAMLEGILNERLEEKAWHKNFAGGWRGDDGTLEAITEACNLNFQIGIRGIELHGQGSEQAATVIERVAQVGGKFAHHLHGSIRVDWDLARDPI